MARSISGSTGQMIAAMAICFVFAGLVGAKFGAPLVASILKERDRLSAAEVIESYDVKDGLVLIGNPYTCSLSSRHLQNLEAIGASLGLGVRFFVPAQDDEDLGPDAVSLILRDFGTGVVPEVVKARVVRPLIGPINSFPAIVIVRNGYVAAVLGPPHAQRVLADVRQIYGISGNGYPASDAELGVEVLPELK